MPVVHTHTEEETLRLGEVVGQFLQPGSIVSLVASLGVGKTWLAKGIAKGVGNYEHDRVTSPAFNLVNEYSDDVNSTKVLHIDFYRLDELSASDVQMFDEYLIDETAVAIVEWGDKFLDSLVQGYLLVQIEMFHDEETHRQFTFDVVGDGDPYLPLIEFLDSKW